MKRRRERRTILLAIIASLVLHFVVAVSLAAFSDRLQPPLPEEDKPAELTIVPVAPAPPPLTPKNSMFVDTPQKRETRETPPEKTFESNANSIASSQLPEAGNAPVPTQDGKERPQMDLENERYSLAANGAQAAPPATPPPAASVAPTPAETSTPEPTPSPTPEAEMLAMLRPTPPPATTPPEELLQTPLPSIPPVRTRPTPPQPSSAYRREQMQNKMRGSISNRGISSVNAMGTPLGRYSKIVYDAVGSRWYSLVHQNGDRINIGTVSITFVVDRSGRITKLNIVSNTSNESFSNLCLESVQDAKLPPMPDDVADALPPEGLEQEVNFTIFPN